MKIRIFKSKKDSLWYFAIVARNGKIVAVGEGYQRRAKAIKTLRRIFSYMAMRRFLAQIARLEAEGAK